MKYTPQASTDESHKLFKIFDNGFVKFSHFPAYVISCRSSSSTQEYFKGSPQPYKSRQRINLFIF